MKKIAFPTDDGETISPHLGRASFFLVASLPDTGEVRFERRDKPHHSQEAEHAAHEHQGQGPGNAMFSAIADCQTLIAGGMGEPAFQHAQAQGLEVLLPAQKNIQLALDSYRAGTLVSDARRIHKR